MQDGARLRRLALAAAMLLMLLGAPPAAAADSAFERRDILVGVEGGEILVYGSGGSLKRTIQTQAREICGMALDDDGRLYATTFRSNSVARFDATGDPAGTFGNAFDAEPESILFDRDGNAYVGQAEGSRNVVKLDGSGRELGRYPVTSEKRGSDWIDLHPDQRTLYYTSEGRTVFRYDLRTREQLDPLTESLTETYALRILPDGDVLVADRTRIVRTDQHGEVVGTYDASDQDYWFALTLDPDGRSFWSADYETGEVVRFEIETGKMLTRFKTHRAVRGLLVAGERTAARSSRLPSFATSLRSPRDVSWSAGHLAVNLLLAAAAVFLIAFPSQLFNATFEEHADEIRRRLRHVPSRLKRFRSGRTPRPWPAFGALILALGFVYAFLDSEFPTGSGSLELYLGVILGLLVTTLVFAGATVGYMQARHHDRGRLRFPEALAIAVVCVAISRLAGFQPGYLYGVVVGVVFGTALVANEEGLSTALAAVWLLVVGLAAWLIQAPIHDRALDAGSWLPIRVLDIALIVTFTAAVEAAVFGLAPLRFLPGAKLFEWSRIAWAALIGAGIFFLVHVLLNPQSGYLSTSPFWVSALLFLAFGLASVLFWGYFRFRPTPRPPKVPSPRGV